MELCPEIVHSQPDAGLAGLVEEYQRWPAPPHVQFRADLAGLVLQNELIRPDHSRFDVRHFPLLSVADRGLHVVHPVLLALPARWRRRSVGQRGWLRRT